MRRSEGNEMSKTDFCPGGRKFLRVGEKGTQQRWRELSDWYQGDTGRMMGARERGAELSFGMSFGGPGRDGEVPILGVAQCAFSEVLAVFQMIPPTYGSVNNCSGNMQIDNTFSALTGLCQSWRGGQFLPVPLSCP